MTVQKEYQRCIEEENQERKRQENPNKENLTIGNIYFSIPIVTRVATIPANSADSRIDVSNMVTQTGRCGLFVQCRCENSHVLEHCLLLL